LSKNRDICLGTTAMKLRSEYVMCVAVCSSREAVIGSRSRHCNHESLCVIDMPGTSYCIVLYCTAAE